MFKDQQITQTVSQGSLKRVELVCDYCGSLFEQPMRNIKKSHKFIAKDACKQCRMKKREETSLIQYGTKVPSQSKEVKRKRNKDNICVEDFHDEIIEMYNSDNNISIKSIADKFNLTRSVLINYLKKIELDTTGNMQAKAKKTTKERYGVEHYLQCEEAQNRLKQTFKERYGSENIYDNKEVKQKIVNKVKETNKIRHGVECIVQDKSRQQEFEKKRKATRIKNGQLMHDGKTIRELAKEKGMAVTSFYQKVQRHGLEYAISHDKYQTNLELDMCKILDKLDVVYQIQFYVDGKIADFYIPEYNTIIEVDGLYWHCDRIIKDENYHVKKRQHYIDRGYRPFFFRENELLEKSDIVKSILANHFGQSIKVGARKCKLVKVDNKVGKQFIKDNHLMGVGSGKYFGLIHNDDLISCICIKHIGDNNYEISRFCHKLGYSIAGGLSRLIKFSLSESSCVSLKTFIDLRYGTGEYLHNLGFSLISTYKSFKWTNIRDTYHRMKFPSNSGYDYGFAKIWDCGQAKWVSEKSHS